MEEKLVVELHLLTKNIWKKVKKSWKIEQYQKRLASVFFDRNSQRFILRNKGGD